MNSSEPKNRLLAITGFAFVPVFAGVYFLEYVLLLPGYTIVKLMFALCMGVFTSFFAIYFSKRHADKELISIFKKFPKVNCLFIAISIIIVYLPFLADGFYFFDDFWSYPGKHVPMMHIWMEQMRPFLGLLTEFFWFVTPSNAYFIKWLSVAFLVLFAFILFQWTLQKSGQLSLSLLFTLALVLFSPISDHIGFSSTISILPGMTTASLSVVLFDRLFEKSSAKEWLAAAVYFLASGFMLLSAFMFYQTATQIVFLFLAIFVFYEKKPSSSIRFGVSYLLFFAFCAVAYLILNKALVYYYGGTPSARGEFTGIHQIPEKLYWLATTVIPAAIDRLGAAFLGRWSVSDKSYWYFLNYYSAITRYIFWSICLFCVLISLNSLFRRKKSILEVVFVLSLFPLSYYVLLVVKQSSFLTYYAIPLLMLLLFFILNAIKELDYLLQHSKLAIALSGLSRTRWQIPIIALIMLLSFQNNTYIRQFYVETNREGYLYLRTSLSLQIAYKTHVHVFGVLTQGQGRIYSIFATRLALRELGYDPANYVITASDNENLVSVLEAADVEQIKKRITAEEFATLMSFYFHDTTYNQYWHSAGPIVEGQSSRLADILKKGGLLPRTLADTAIVDLRWISPTWLKSNCATISSINNMNKIIASSRNLTAWISLLNYSRVTDSMDISGWAAISDVDSTNSQVYIILSSKGASFEIKGTMHDSVDVVLNRKNRLFSRCRFDFGVDAVSSKLPKGKYEVWIYIVNSPREISASYRWTEDIDVN